MSEQDANIDRERAVADYKHAILQSVEHDEAWGKQAFSPDYDKYQMQWNAERSKQLDENEAVAKEQYVEQHGEAETGLPADAYRHQVISERVDQQLAADSDQKKTEELGGNYWDEQSRDGAKGAEETRESVQAGAGTSVEEETAETGAKASYWDGDNAAQSNGAEASQQDSADVSNSTDVSGSADVSGAAEAGASSEASAECDNSL